MTKNEIAWSPQPRQATALSCPADELFYGGAAGGGKTDFLLNDFLKGVNYGADHSGVLFRKTYPEFDQIIKRSKEIYYKLGAVYTDGKGLWKFPGGAQLKFRHLDSDKIVHNYQGHEYSWIGFDELTNWPTDYCYRYLFSRNRSSAGLPCRMRAAGNPGGVGHGWVKTRFVDGKKPEVIYKYRKQEEVKDKNGKVIKPEIVRTRVYIPAKLDDNTILMKNDPGYEGRLMELEPHLYKALRLGDWDIFAGQVFGEWRQDRHVVEPFSLPGEWFRFAALDWGYSKPFCIGWYCVTPEGRLIKYREWYGCEPGVPDKGIQLNASVVAERAYKMGVAEGIEDLVCDPSIWKKEGMGKSDEESKSIADYFEDVGFRLYRAMNDRINGKMVLHDFLKTNGHDTRPMILFFDCCRDTIRTLPALTADIRKPEDVDTTLEDHAYDETRYAVTSSLVNSKPKQVERWQTHTQIMDDDDYEPMARKL